MPTRPLRLPGLLLSTLALLMAGAPAARAEPEGNPFGGDRRVRVELVAPQTSVEPGTKVWVGIRLEHDEHWHTYWKHGGDAGSPTTIQWVLPPGWTMGEIEWPTPTRHILPGGVAGYGYEDDVILPVQVTVPPEAAEGTVTLTAEVGYQVCNDTCEQGSDTVSIKLEVSKAPPKDGPLARRFAELLEALPKPLADPGIVSVRGLEKTIELTLAGGGPWALPDAQLLFLALESRVIEYAGDQSVRRGDGGTTLTLPRALRRAKKAPRLLGLLAVALADGKRVAFPLDRPIAWEGEPLPPSSTSPTPPPTSAGGAPPARPGPEEPHAPGAGGPDDGRGTWAGFALEPGSDLWRYAGLDRDAEGRCREYVDDEIAAGRPTLVWLLLLAFVGGLILNLMPCVLPVLSVKILGFVSQAGEEPARARRHGYAFAMGVLASFWLLAGVLIGLRSAGEELGWGFQLQEPGFVAALAVLMTAVGLNLFGVFEVGTSVMNLAGEASTRIHATGYASSFWSGALATAIATPCTAPFMGPAVGYAVTAPWHESLLLFTALGLGMAAPYVVLSASPRLLKKVPRPGPWMDTFKHALAFPMFAVALYLAWVFGRQTGVDGAIWLLFGLLTVSIGLWVYGRWGGPEQAPGRRWILGRALPAAFVLLAALAFITPATRERPPPRGASGEWEPWLPEKVAWHLSQGRAVFVDFTADWCLSCLANERAFLDTDTVREAVRQHGVVLLKGDWTNRDALIHSELKAYRRTSVPLYVVFSPHRVPHVLGSAITAGGVARALAAGATR